jgi:thiamine-monophosphate kinase
MKENLLKDIGERAWLDRAAELLGGKADPRLAVPIGDDAAVLRLGGGRCLVVTSDAQVEGTHFRRSWLGWAGLARRTLLSAASDITAMGGIPTGFLISLGVPPRTTMAALEAFTSSLSRISQEYNLSSLGGDTVRSQPILVDVTVLGEVREKDILRQSGAQVGDALWVTGSLGQSRAQVAAKTNHPRWFPGFDHPDWWPPVRWPLVKSLRKALPLRAMTDLSDGLALDLAKILRWERLGAEIHLERLPVAPAAEEWSRHLGFDPFECAYLGGEDYELLVVEQGDSQRSGRIDLEGTPLVRIGRVTHSKGNVRTLWHGKTKRIEGAAFQHFS